MDMKLRGCAALSGALLLAIPAAASAGAGPIGAPLSGQQFDALCPVERQAANAAVTADIARADASHPGHHDLFASVTSDFAAQIIDLYKKHLLEWVGQPIEQDAEAKLAAGFDQIIASDSADARAGKVRHLITDRAMKRYLLCAYHSYIARSAAMTGGGARGG